MSDSYIHILFAIIFLTGIATGLVCQETPYHVYGPSGYFGDFSGYCTVIENVKVNAQNRCYYLTHFNEWNPAFEETNTYGLGYLDTDNIPHTISLDGITMHFPIGFQMVLFGEGVAFPCIDSTNFYWRYFDPVNNNVVSDSLALPFADISQVSVNQADEAHAMLIMKADTGACFVAYVDAQAHAEWSFILDSSIMAPEDNLINPAAPIDNAHFIIGVEKFNPRTLSVIQCNSNGEMEHSASRDIDGYAFLFPTEIPGTVVISYLKDGIVNFDRYADQALTTLITQFPQLYSLMGTGDETGFLYEGRTAINGLNIKKYNWDGELLWQKAWNVTNNGRQDNLDISANGNYYMAFETSNRYLLARVMGDGETTGTDDNSSVDVPELGFSLYPNPFTDELKVNISTKTSQSVSVNIYNLKGQLVRSWDGLSAQAGKTVLNWDGRNAQGQSVSDGLYFIQLKSREGSLTKKVLCWHR